MANEMTFEKLPVGLIVLKHYESQGVTLVECAHAPEHRAALVGREGEICLICKTTAFERPVKLGVRIPASERAKAGTLF
jgi:hypothetical protein